MKMGTPCVESQRTEHGGWGRCSHAMRGMGRVQGTDRRGIDAADLAHFIIAAWTPLTP